MKADQYVVFRGAIDDCNCGVVPGKRHILDHLEHVGVRLGTRPRRDV